MVQEPTPFNWETLRYQLLLQNHRDMTWIKGLPRPPPHALDAADLPEASDTKARHGPLRPSRHAHVPASTSTTALEVPDPSHSIADQMAAIAR
ncbi:unnamed protein product [Linum trigynum]|uniref:Uncharacterized protein n=1 Tax=Linum trigynum TaxID=586398 RepID=A0AAV2E4U4_9ROSI